MKLSPRNKRIVVDKIISDKEIEADPYLASFVLESKVKKNITEVYVVLDVASDCTLEVSAGDMIVVESNMVEESKGTNFQFLTVKENFVVGVLRE